MKSFSDYQKNRWFFTSEKKLVVGGKSATQNEELLKKVQNKNYIIMHTSTPGSPFAVIVADKKSLSSSDLEETAVFTACFSQQWKQQKKKTQVDIFSTRQIFKDKNMKIGTWGVKPKIKIKTVLLSLVLTKQKGKLRAVPEKTTSSFLLKIKPGNTDKTKMADKIQKLLDNKFSKEEILSALPPGGVSISK